MHRTPPCRSTSRPLRHARTRALENRLPRHRTPRSRTRSSLRARRSRTRRRSLVYRPRTCLGNNHSPLRRRRSLRSRRRHRRFGAGGWGCNGSRGNRTLSPRRRRLLHIGRSFAARCLRRSLFFLRRRGRRRLHAIVRTRARLSGLDEAWRRHLRCDRRTRLCRGRLRSRRRGLGTLKGRTRNRGRGARSRRRGCFSRFGSAWRRRRCRRSLLFAECLQNVTWPGNLRKVDLGLDARFTLPARRPRPAKSSPPLCRGSGPALARLLRH